MTGSWLLAAGLAACLAALSPAASANQPGKLFRDCPSCPEMKVVPAAPAGQIPGRTPVQPLAVGTTPVTFRDWEQCVRDGGCGGYQPDRQDWPADNPVVNVSYDDAQRYVAWLRTKTGRPYRLAREHEWAWLARGGRTSIYPWGDALGSGKTNCLGCGSAWDGRRASPVRSFEPNAFGLYDMVGNIAHWLEPPSAGAGRCWNKPGHAAIFGAAWSEPARYLDVAEGSCMIRLMRDDAIGFRVVAEEPGAIHRE